MGNMQRLGRLQDLAEECMSIYSPRTQEALDTGLAPRYALVTAEGSSESIYQDNRDLTVFATTDELAEAIAENLEEGWPPVQVVDLETGEDVNYRVKIEIGESDGS